MNIKVGDTVKVIAGDDKGSTGKVLKVIRNKNRVIVEGVAMVKKHNKPNSNKKQRIKIKMSKSKIIIKHKLNIKNKKYKIKNKT